MTISPRFLSRWMLRFVSQDVAELTRAARRQAFLEAADVASKIRDEYEASAKNLANGVRVRERYNRDATVARQIKGAILARANIQEWPAPKPEVGGGTGEPIRKDGQILTSHLATPVPSAIGNTSATPDERVSGPLEGQEK